MAVVVNYQALSYWAQNILGQANARQWTVRLFVNLHTPLPQDALTQYLPCTWPGYSDFLLNPTEWSPAQTSSGSPWTYPLITFNFDAASIAQQTVFGYVVFDGGGVIMYAEAFSAPFPISSQGGSIPIQLFWTDQQC
jgi:hypothetical protein